MTDGVPPEKEKSTRFKFRKNRKGGRLNLGVRKGWLRALAQGYGKSSIAYFLREIEPVGVLVAALGLVLTAAALWMSFFQLTEIEESRENSRITNEAMLYGLVSERLEEARKLDRGRLPPESRAGQRPILERLVELGMELKFLQAYKVNLAGAVLACADLEGANLAGSVMTDSNLQGASLTDASLRGTNLVRANLRRASIGSRKVDGANFKGASFENTRLYKVDMTSVRGFSRVQLRGACGQQVVLPDGWSIERCTTEQLQLQGCE